VRGNLQQVEQKM